MAPPLRVETECLLDEGTEWIVGRSTESVGLMYSADCGLRDRLADSHQKYSQLEYFFLCRCTACVSPRVCEAYGLADSEYIRLNQWAFLYLELHRTSLYPSLDLRTACYSGAVKIT